MRLLLLFAALAVAPQLPAADLPVPAKEAAAKFTLPKGFSATLFAGEPDIVQPIAFTFDDRGRMWVVECLMYPKWSQDGKGGKDRVVILEDTDGDGKFDKKTVVLDDGVNLSGIELGFGGVYLCSSPNLIFVPIKDDKPAGKAEILLDGWNIKDAKHNVFNGLVWGPDGWLYGCNGIQTKSKVGKPGTPDKDRVAFDCGVWRFHPTKKVFEVVATGTTNPWGLDFDEHGEMFITNCVIDHLFHVVPGGRYTRMYGEDYNPHTYGYMGSAVDYKHWGSGAWTDSRADQKTGALKKEHDDAGGGHAHSGAAIYLGENFPAEYRNTLFTCNIHGNRLNNDGLQRTATGMKGVRRPDFQFANDPWFRGICVKQGPDGGLYTSDWSDTGECHNYQVVDASNGRIYRTVYGECKAWKGDVGKMTDQELVKAVTSKNEWLSRKARRVLQERAAAGTAKPSVDELSKQMKDAKTTAERLRMLWAGQALFGHKGVSISDPHHDPIAQIWSIRLNGDQSSLKYSDSWSMARRMAARFMSSDNSIPALRAKADQLRKHALDLLISDNGDRRGPLLDEAFRGDPLEDASGTEPGLLEHKTDADTVLMFWYAVDAADLDMPRLIKAKAKQPILFDFLARKLIAIADKPLTAADGILKVLPDMPSDECRAAAVHGLTDSLGGAKAIVPSETWREVYALYSYKGISRTSGFRERLDDLGLLLGDEAVIKSFKLRATDPKADAVDRARAIALLSGRKLAGFDAALLSILGDEKVRGATIRALATYPNEKTPAAILGVYAKLSADEKADAVQTLASRGSYALALLSAVEKGTVPKADITAFTARQIAAIKDKAVAAKLAAVWGEVKPASANRKPLMDKYKGILTAEKLASANAGNGRVLFTKNCATCHKLFGEGQAVGPELTGSQRSNLDYVLENVVDPNAVVANEYKMTQFYLLDGRVVSGIVKKDTGKAVTVRTVNEELVIPVADIEVKKPTQLSVMPEGLFDALKPEEVLDLVKYLMGKEQVPLPK